MGRLFQLALSVILFVGMAWGSDSPPTLKVLTLNVFAGTYGMDFNRLKRQIEAVKAIDADVIALQETFDEGVRQAYREVFSDYEIVESGVHPISLTPSSKLVHLLHDSVDYAHRKLNVAAWSKGSRAILNGDTHGLMILLKKKKGIVKLHSKTVKTFRSQVSPGLARYFELVKPKGFLWVEYQIAGIPIVVVNTHLSNGVHNTRRFFQLDEIYYDLRSRDQNDSRGDCPVLFCGDTNADSEEMEMKWWHSDDAGFRDTFAEKNQDLSTVKANGATWNNDNPLTKGHLIEPNQRMDFVSVRDSAGYQFEILSSQLVFDTDPVSDHYGVLSELKILPRCENVLEKEKK